MSKYHQLYLLGKAKPKISKMPTFNLTRKSNKKLKMNKMRSIRSTQDLPEFHQSQNEDEDFEDISFEEIKEAGYEFLL